MYVMENKCPLFTSACPYLNKLKEKCPHYNNTLPKPVLSDRSACPLFTENCPYLNELKNKCPHYSKQVE